MRRYLNEAVVQLRLWWRLLRDPRVPETLKLLVPALAFVYLLWPMDILSDLVPLFGQLDDVAILLLAFRLFQSLAPAGLVAKHLADLRAPRRASPKADDGDVIDADYRVLQ
ncbi:MAG: YkvA family protein [Anaerolineae bacterium]